MTVTGMVHNCDDVIYPCIILVRKYGRLLKVWLSEAVTRTPLIIPREVAFDEVVAMYDSCSIDDEWWYELPYPNIGDFYGNKSV